MRSKNVRRMTEVVCCVALLGLTACEVVKMQVGSELRADPATIKIGQTTMPEVLELFGAPEKVQRRSRGDVFVYSYWRRDSRKLTLEEPVVTNTELYTYKVIREDSNRLVVIFDEEGVVTGYGHRTGDAERPAEAEGPVAVAGAVDEAELGLESVAPWRKCYRDGKVSGAGMQIG